MNRIFLTLTLLLTISSVLRAQSEFSPCGTKDQKSDWLIKYQANPDGYEKSDDPLYVALAIHIVGDDNGNGYFPKNRVFDALCVLNEDFEPANIHFYTSTDFDYIAESDYYEHNFNQGSNMMNNYYTYNKVDCYIVKDPAGNCGYSSYGDGIALAKGCLSSVDHTWSHEMGHYLSLPHTFLGWEGYEHDYSEPAPNSVNGVSVEKVDASNCSYAGDGFCDTPPDYLNTRWSCDAQGKSTQIQHDPTGVAFRSDGSFYMSYSNGACKTQFSDEQIAAMRANLENEQSYLLTSATPLPDITNDATILYYPIEGEQAPLTGNDMILTWQNMSNATGYLVQINPFPNFGSALFEAYVTTPEITVPNLEVGKKYYWRVRALSEWSSCSPFSLSTSFWVTTPVAVNELEGIQHLTIMPNPVGGGADIRLRFEAQSPLSLSLSVLNAQGKIVSLQNIKPEVGLQFVSIPTASLSPGIYFLQLQSSKGFHYEKFVVQ